MTPDEYRERNQARARGTNPTLEPDRSRLALYGLGLTGEAGEVADLIKKHLFHDQPLDRDAALKEMGDVLWYLDRLARALDFTMSDVMEANTAKLDERHPHGWSPAYHAAPPTPAEPPGQRPEEVNWPSWADVWPKRSKPGEPA